MTDETKDDGMTLEQVRDYLRCSIYEDLNGLADAIDNHLAAQSAMRVDEAMVERACVAGAEASTPNVEWSYYEPLAKERLRTFTSAALQAAIGGKE